jgi:hypothetical protein
MRQPQQPKEQTLTVGFKKGEPRVIGFGPCRGSKQVGTPRSDLKSPKLDGGAVMSDTEEPRLVRHDPLVQKSRL